MAHILVVEDNADLAEGLRYNLELEGYEVAVAEDGDAALSAARRRAPDLLILDLMLPGMHGFQVLQTLRVEGMHAPVLVLTASAGLEDREQAFRLDADHYVSKPFRLTELLERVRSLLRRAASRTAAAAAAQEGGTLAFGDVRVNTAARRVTVAGREVSLTPKAYDLLLALVRRRGAVASRVELLKEVWGHRGMVLTRTVDSHVAELRRKLEENPSEPRHIVTVWKVGYRFEP